MTDQERWDAMSVDNKYGCYCELYKLSPLCKIPKGKPKTLKCTLIPCFIVYGLAVVCFITLVISICVTQIEICKIRCGGECLPSSKHCDGIKDCHEWKDEIDCSQKFKFVPANAVGVMGRNGRIVSRAVIGNKTLQWYVTDIVGEVTIFTASKDTSDSDYRFGLRVRPQSDHMDLVIWHVQRIYRYYTFDIHLSGDKTETVNFIPSEELQCTPSEAGARVVEGEMVNFTASVDFYGATQPALFWYAGNTRMEGSESTTDHSGYTTLTVTSTITADRGHNDLTIAAHLFEAFPVDFNSPPSDAADTCTTRLNVLYPPYDVSTNYKSRTSPGSDIHCSAEGNPAPTLSWNCEDGEYIHYGATLVVPDGAPSKMWCVCTATNIIDGDIYTAYESIVLNTSGVAGLHGEMGVVAALLALLLINSSTPR